MKRLGLAIAAFIPLTAHAFSLGWPVACTLGDTCFIQNFVDHDSSPEAHDFTCGTATYDGHDGTDIRLRDLAAMQAGVAVVAAADGIVIGTRDHMEDISIRAADAPDVHGHECGNGVQLQHAEGYRTQYCHMRKGSIRVHAGDHVTAGQALGFVGLSGDTEFPHLHLTVFKDDTKIDPFTSDSVTSTCSTSLASAPHALWSTPVVYQPTALLKAGFAAQAPTAEQLADALTNADSIPSNAPALIFWVNPINLRAEDVEELSITAPDGSILAHQRITLAKAKAVDVRYIGKKNSSGVFPTGRYDGTVTISRGQIPLLSATQSVVVK